MFTWSLRNVGPLSTDTIFWVWEALKTSGLNQYQGFSHKNKLLHQKVAGKINVNGSLHATKPSHLQKVATVKWAYQKWIVGLMTKLKRIQKVFTGCAITTFERQSSKCQPQSPQKTQNWVFSKLQVLC